MFDEADQRLISTVSVLKRRWCWRAVVGRMQDAIWLYSWRRGPVTTVSFVGEQIAIARLAFRRYGKGRHRAALNFGDCAAFVAWFRRP